MRISDWNSDVCSSDLSSTPALLKTRHSTPTTLEASVDAVAVRGVAEATRRGASGRSGLVGEDRAAGLLRNGFTDLLRVVAEFHGHERARDEDGNFGAGRILRNRLQIAALDEIVVVDDGVRDNGRDATFLHFEHIRSRRDLRDRLDRSRSARVVGRFLETRAEEQRARSEEPTSELQSLMRISYSVLCLKKKKK